MLFFTFSTYFIFFLLGVLAAPPMQPELQLRAEDACGTYRNDDKVGTLWLYPICHNMDFSPVNATRVTNSKCQMCLLFTSVKSSQWVKRLWLMIQQWEYLLRRCHLHWQ